MANDELFEIQIPYERVQQWDDRKIQKYRELLAKKVFPAVDELKGEKLISLYYFITHQNLDLRIVIPIGRPLEPIQTVLKKWALPTEIRKMGGERKEYEDVILELNSEITRLLLNHPNTGQFYYEVGHFQNNQFGMSNHLEIEWFIQQAIAWHCTVLASSGVPADMALSRARADLSTLIQSIPADTTLP